MQTDNKQFLSMTNHQRSVDFSNTLWDIANAGSGYPFAEWYAGKSIKYAGETGNQALINHTIKVGLKLVQESYIKALEGAMRKGALKTLKVIGLVESNRDIYIRDGRTDLGRSSKLRDNEGKLIYFDPEVVYKSMLIKLYEKVGLPQSWADPEHPKDFTGGIAEIVGESIGLNEILH
ncbi:MAG: hypothetical protein ABIG93_02145 [archaeon]|nr:hypothetical protein [Nanoarchaeota archaeon]